MAGIRDWWNMNPPAPTPSARYAHAMAYDSARGKMILFGGNTGSATLGDTWEYDPVANTWTNRAPASAPSARYAHAMAYDSARGKVILFGGYTGAANNETWEYDPVANTWTNRAPASAPSARYVHAMVYDSARGKVILFGGYTGAANNETWEYDPVANTWTNRAPASAPSARFDHAMVYDSARGKVILFGGNTGTVVSPALSNETWEYDPVANTWTNRAPASAPSARSSYAMVYDSARGKVILFGGYTGAANNETWEYDPVANTWTNRAPASAPSARYQHAMIYDSTWGKIVLFGGRPTNNETWELWLRLALLFAKTTGQPTDDFNFGSVIANNVLGPVAIDLWNGTGTTVSIAQVSIPDIPAGEGIELSKTADPFIPESPLTFNGTFATDTKIGTLYVRIRPAITSEGPKEFTFSATSTPT